MNHRVFSLSLLLLAPPILHAQSWTEGVEQTYVMQYSQSDGSTPLWLHSNKHGLGSLESSNGYVRAQVERPLSVDSLGRWGIGYGGDLVLPMGYTSNLVVQQCYAEARYLHGVLTLGQKEQPMELRNQRLSSGVQTLGINARPVPGIRLSFPTYYDIPGLGHWVALKGHVFYGVMTDGDWQKEWTCEQSHYAQGELLHTKAGYLRLGPDNDTHPFSLELGLEMACQFGGTMYHTNHGTVEGASGFGAYVDAFFAQGSDEADDTYHNVGGNQLGSWVARLNYEWPAVRASVYADHFFEDHSSMFFVDYDGYGDGEQWNSRMENSYLMYPLRDMQLGIELQFKRFPWLNALVLEYLDSRYQSGPIYHDHNPGVSDHIGGDDNYYNHYLYQGWSHWGQVMGNPFYRSPLYNQDHTLTIENNRFYAWHCGLSGEVPQLSYRMLLSWQQGYGTYQYPLTHPQCNLSAMAEATYRPEGSGFWNNCAVRVAFALDHGELLGNNLGAQLTFIYHLVNHSQR